MSETLTIEIDGKSCTCEKGEYLYDVAMRNGVFIPKLCRSDAFEEHRSCCRICIVEVEARGRAKVVTSCVYPVETACTVRTNSERIKEERAVIMALLEHRAPDSDTIRMMSTALGGHEGFERLTALDSGKCILCGLCVQACSALGTGAISTVMRGTDKKVGTPYDKATSSCIGCLSCANVCPTGEIRFTEDETTRSIWHRSFELAHCEECGKVMGTADMMRRAAEQNGTEVETLCDECRKRRLAEEMRSAYRYV